MHAHELATFSTVDRDNNANGAVVYYYPAPEGYIYILTKGETQKAHDALHNPHIALTIHDTETLQTLQLQGDSAIESDADKKHEVYTKLVHEHEYGKDKSMPPVTKLKHGAFMVLRISPTQAKFRDYKKN